LQHKQTFDQSAAISALASLANSGNLDSGGGWAPLHEPGTGTGCLHLGPNNRILTLAGWWNHPQVLKNPILGEMIQFDEHVFQLGWFNHQLDRIGGFDGCFWGE